MIVRSEFESHWRGGCSNRRPVALCTLGLGLLNLPSFHGWLMSIGYGWEDLRQVCGMLLCARHVPGFVYLSAI